MEKVILQEGDTFTSAHANALVNEITNVIESTEITPAQGEQLLTAIEKIAENHATPLVDGLNSADTSKALSAKQGKVLKGLIDKINTVLSSNDVSLDSLQELVNFIKANKSKLNALSISNINGLQAELDNKREIFTKKINANTTLSNDDKNALVLIDASARNITITLPATTANDVLVFDFVVEKLGTNKQVHFVPSGADKINNDSQGIVSNSMRDSVRLTGIAGNYYMS